MKPSKPLPRISKKRLSANGGKMPWSSIQSKPKPIRKRARKKAETSSLPWKRMMQAERLRLKREKEARAYARKYGSKARVEFVRSLPCAACGVVGYSENAHVPPKSEAGGTGRKADYRFIAPLCGPHEKQAGRVAGYVRYPYSGCHHFLHHYGREEFQKMYGFDLEAEAAKTHAAWLAHNLGSRVPQERGEEE